MGRCFREPPSVVGRLPAGGEHDARWVLERGKPPRYLESVGPGELDIEEDRVGSEGSDHKECRLAVRRLPRDLEALGDEHRPQQR